MSRIVTSSIMLGLTLAGCSIIQQNRMFRPAAQSAAAARADQSAARLYELAQQATQKGDFVQALAYSERAVEKSPRDAGYRMLLGDLYLKNGRFFSAETAFSDVLILYPDNVRARFNLALAEIALGKQNLALAQLDRLSTIAAPADLGLAYALAGQTGRALELLELAARKTGADGRVRQNLALTYALQGDWKRARAIAAQDLSPADLGARMEQWALFVQPKASHEQVASLMGVVAAEDAGQPVRLALQKEEEKTIDYAAISADVAAASATVPAALAKESVQDVQAPQDAQTPQAQVPTQPADLVTIHRGAPVQLAGVGANRRYVVQLGVYRSVNMVEVVWPAIRRRYNLGSRVPVSGTIMLKKGMYHSLSLAGFVGAKEALRLCQSIKGKGGECFVRPASGEMPVRFALLNVRKS